MLILVLNSGSSSLKYQLFKAPAEQPICSGLVERIGVPGSEITHKVWKDGNERVFRIRQNITDQEAGLLAIRQLMTQHGNAVIGNPDEIGVVGHRIVHGGEKLRQTTIITPEVKAEIKRLFSLAPLHNPGNYADILVAEKIFPEATQIAVFDTAFHQSLPEMAYHYALPDTFYSNFGIRVYGFHGISHQYVSAKAAAYLNHPEARLITIHLGNGCSMAAIKAGRCLDTSMGLTPLDGLVMGTRCGAIDASVLLYLMEQEGYTAKQLSELLNKKSGMLGLTGHSDMRDIRKMLTAADPRAKLAYELYAYRIKKFIGAYTAVLNGLDAVVFTAGVGENDELIREMVCCEMDYLGIRLDKEKNQLKTTGIREIGVIGGSVKIMVIPTNEELEIARQCQSLLLMQ